MWIFFNIYRWTRNVRRNKTKKVKSKSLNITFMYINKRINRKYSSRCRSLFIIDPSYQIRTLYFYRWNRKIVVQSGFSASLQGIRRKYTTRHEIRRTKAWKKRKIEEAKRVSCYFICNRTTDEELKLIRRKEEYNNEKRTLRWNVCRENDDDSHSFFHFVLEISREKEKKGIRLGYS